MVRIVQRGPRGGTECVGRQARSDMRTLLSSQLANARHAGGPLARQRQPRATAAAARGACEAVPVVGLVGRRRRDLRAAVAA
eukprot:238694-Prymnesium_polylepis.1